MPKKVIIKIDASDAGRVYDVSKRLKEKYLPNGTRVIPNKKNWEVTIEDIDRKDVEIAMQRYLKGLGKPGHGGARFNYNLEEIDIPEKEIIEGKVRKQYMGEIETLKERQRQLEEKWAKERNEHKGGIKELQGLLKLEMGKYSKMENEFEERLCDTRNEYEKLLVVAGERIGKLEGRLRQVDETPVYKLFLERLVRFVRR